MPAHRAEDDALEALRHKIERLHVHNGEPSTRVISGRTGRAISHTTVHNVLRCATLPTWGQLELVVEQLGGDVEEFRTLWIDARDAKRGVTPRTGNIKPTDGTSPASGNLVSDSALHGQDSRDAKTEVLGDLLLGFVDKLERVGVGSSDSVLTGHTDLDSLLNGLEPGQLIIIAGRPAIGKSMLALGIGRNAAIRQTLPTLFVSPRATKNEILLRIFSAEARMPLHVLRAARLSDDDWAKLARRMGEIREAPLFINDDYAPSMDTVAMEAREASRKHGIQLLIVDSVQQLMEQGESPNNRPTERDISRFFKLLALELRIPVVLISGVQHGLDNEGTFHPKVPELEDLKGMDEDADVVIFVHRDDYYDVESPRAGEADLIVARHRDGPTDIVTVVAQLHLSRFVDMAVVP